MRYTVEYSWTDRNDVEQTGHMGDFATIAEADLYVDTVAAMLDTIAEHWGVWVEMQEASA